MRAGLPGLLLAAIVPAFAAPGRAAEPVAPDPAAEASMFWADREASYRAERRGPFTAIRSDYLGYGEGVSLFVVDGRLTDDPSLPGPKGAAIMVRFAAPGFAVSRVEEKGWEYATREGRPILEIQLVGETAGDEEDVRVGRFLLSFGLQGERTGRVLAYDPDLLEKRFRGFPVFPFDARYRVTARILPAEGDTVRLGTSRGREKPYVRAAKIELAIDGRNETLVGFRPPGEVEGSLFVPFRDATSGGASYGVGRYLSVEPAADGTAVVDFNRATNPWCAYSPFYNCVLPPATNELNSEIRAGERAPAEGEGH
jgi:hypothetical protein